MAKIVLFHPWIKSKGGAEKVVLEIAKNFDVEIYTWVYDRENTFPEFENFDVKVIGTRFGKRLSRLHVLRGLFLPLNVFRKIPLDNADKFLVSTSGLAEFVLFRNYLPGKTYVYSHTTLRDADDRIVKWNLENRYRSTFSKGFYLGAVGVYNFFERLSWKRIERVIFNSKFTEERAKRKGLLDKHDVRVVYPPVDFGRINLSGKEKKQFFYFSRINTPKRQDVLIEAWKRFSLKHPDYRLVIAGTVDNSKYFSRLKGLVEGNDSVEIVEGPSDEELGRIIGESMAGFFLGYQEDAGIAPLEVVALGKPLIGVDEGGYVDMVRGNSLFYPIRERHDKEAMVEEILRGMERTVEGKRIKKDELKIGDFVKEMKEFLE